MSTGYRAIQWNRDKLVYDGGAEGQGIVPYLPLNELTTRRQPPTNQPQPGTGGVR